MVLARSVAESHCRDTPGWKNPYGSGCSDFVRDGHCGGASFLPGHEWAADAEFGSPGLHCCVCGKGSVSAKGGKVSSNKKEPCHDVANWANQFGASCASYSTEGHCADGHFVEGHEWSAGPTFGNPENNCCVCGKDAVPLTQSDHPTTLPLKCADTPGWEDPWGTSCSEYEAKVRV